MVEHSIDALVETFIKMRDKRAELEDQRKKIKKDMDLIGSHLMARAETLGVESLKTSKGTAFKDTKDFIAVRDWDKALAFILENKLTWMLTKSVMKSAAKEYMEEHKQLPEGLEYGTKAEIKIRR